MAKATTKKVAKTPTVKMKVAKVVVAMSVNEAVFLADWLSRVAEGLLDAAIPPSPSKKGSK